MSGNGHHQASVAAPPAERQFDFWLGEWKVTWDVLWHIHYERVTDQSG